ncbi:hypothetical protein HZA45_00490 [Candidatus Peregrinibacteria bacterium]|nr:hypothetical protein [Candidatus Peregrinibacteria bacterium]
MPATTFDIAQELPHITAELPSDSAQTADRALVLFNEARALHERSILRYTGFTILLIAVTWLNQQFLGKWAFVESINGKVSHGQWLAMLVYGQFAELFTNLFGEIAERTCEKRKEKIPTNPAAAFPFSAPALKHLSLLWFPITLMIGGQTETIEFIAEGNEVHVRWADHEACLWLVEAEDANLIMETNVSTLATDVIKRSGCIEVYAGYKSSHVSEQSLSTILEELQLGGRDILSNNIESTSLSTNAGHTIRFELIA